MRALVLLLAACTVPSEHFATYTIAAGMHESIVTDRIPKDPIDGVTDVTERDYELALDRSAIYDLGTDDQLDWNKLPGLSDCGEVDLAKAGAMFGWRWRVDLQVLEITGYANVAGVHCTLDAPLVTLDADELDALLTYRVARTDTAYVFSIGAVSGELPRGCAGAPLDPLAWASSFYFGGTSVAPHAITARMHELAVGAASRHD